MTDDYPQPRRRQKLEITFDDLDEAETAPYAAPPRAYEPATRGYEPPPPAYHPPPPPAPSAQSHGTWPAPQPTGHDPGYAVAAMAMNRKSAGVAVLLSLLFTGAGQIYCGRAGRGIAFFFGAVFSAVCVLFLIGFIMLPVVWIWAAVDAAHLANRQNDMLLAAFSSR